MSFKSLFRTYGVFFAGALCGPLLVLMLAPSIGLSYNRVADFCLSLSNRYIFGATEERFAQLNALYRPYDDKMRFLFKTVHFCEKVSNCDPKMIVWRWARLLSFSRSIVRSQLPYLPIRYAMVYESCMENELQGNARLLKDAIVKEAYCFYKASSEKKEHLWINLVLLYDYRSLKTLTALARG